MANATINPIKPSAGWDTYRFGNGPQLVMLPGTMGWNASDLSDPLVRMAWDAGRFEILDGVLTIMPAAYFLGGECCAELLLILKQYFRSKSVAAKSSIEVDIQISSTRVIRADVAFVIGEDLARFNSLKLPKGITSWRKNGLTIPPTLIIESVSLGHEDHDRQTKRKWYAEFGVKHYWIVDGFSKSLDCLLLHGEQYVSEALGGNSDVLNPASLPGLSIPLKDVWGD